MHEFESGFFGGNEAAWHGLGRVIQEDVVHSDEAIEYAGLDWEVEKFPVYAEVPSHLDGFPTRVPVSDYFATLRSTDNAPLGVVGTQYTPIQNREAFAFGDNLVDSGEAKWHTAGALRGGRQVWMLMRQPEDIVIAGIEEERVARFLAVCNTHDGSGALQVFPTRVRIVCNNTLTAAIRGATRMWSLRHTSGIKGRLDEARRTLELSFKFDEALAALGEDLIGQPMTDSEYRQFIETLLPYPPEILAAIERGEKNRSLARTDNARASIGNIYRTAGNLDHVRGTRWAALQAVGEYSDHDRTIRRTKKTSELEARFLRQVTDNTLKSQALKLLAPEWASKAGQNLEIDRELAAVLA